MNEDGKCKRIGLSSVQRVLKDYHFQDLGGPGTSRVTMKRVYKHLKG